MFFTACFLLVKNTYKNPYSWKAVKIDEEYQNLHTLHSALGFKQENSISNSKFAHQIVDQYGSAIFTCGKFVFGQMAYGKVLSDLSNPMTFAEYIQLPESKQSPIDELVKQRTVAQLIVKNSSNKRLKEHLITAYSTTKDECYPNTISDALSLLSTFAKQGQNIPSVDAVVSYHESTTDVIQNDESTLPEEMISESNNDVIETIDNNKEDNTSHVSFNEHIMAAIISEASNMLKRTTSLVPASHDFKMSMMCITLTNQIWYVEY
jgi:hypothetical protein